MAAPPPPLVADELEQDNEKQQEPLPSRGQATARNVMSEVAMSLAASRSFDTAAALHASAPFRAGVTELDHALAYEVLQKLSIRGVASLACTSPAMAALAAPVVDSDVSVLLCKYQASFTTHYKKVEKRFNASLSQAEYAQADDYEDLPEVYYDHYSRLIGWLSSKHSRLDDVDAEFPQRNAQILGIVAASICGSSEARGRSRGWDAGIEDLWYDDLYPDVSKLLRLVKKCGMPPAVLAKAHSDLDAHDGSFRDYFDEFDDEDNEGDVW